MEDTSEAWEENDPETRSADTLLWQHMIAGSCAGMVEHALCFPLDTIKTHVQATNNATAASGAAASGPPPSTFQVTRDIVRLRGLGSLWRGVSVMLRAVIPAHAMMFAAYEGILHYGGAHGVEHADASSARVAAVGFAAGAVSTLFHDAVMVPAETIKQRMQLGYYRNASHATHRMVATGGASLYRALPTTLAMNVPYAALMMATNESLRRALNPSGAFSLPTYLCAGVLSGGIAAALTNPLDVVKTRLQTQGMTRAKTSTGELGGAPRGFVVRYAGFADAAAAVARERGPAGFFRGYRVRVLQIAPSCALSWCAYESAKKVLQLDWAVVELAIPTAPPSEAKVV